jgi:hypothetical protein
MLCGLIQCLITKKEIRKDRIKPKGKIVIEKEKSTPSFSKQHSA